MSTSRERPIRTLAVVGAGNMGSGIAQKMATEGFPVVLVDLDDAKVERGLAIVEQTLAEGVARKVFRAEDAKTIRGLIRGTTDWSSLAEADLVVEAVFEDLEVKREVFRRLERACRPDAVLGTNTSSFAVADVARGLERPERVIGLHYFYHPAKNRLVEVIAGPESDGEAVSRAWALQERLGKTPIASADVSGFIVNRFFVPWLNEAVRLLEEGAADIPTIEAAAKKAFGVGMGPFELMNVTGVPIALHAANTLGAAFGPMYAPSELLKERVAAGTNWPLDGAPGADGLDAVSERLLAVTFLVACQLVDEEVGTIEDTDIGARVGLRWPRGPFELMNRVGIERAAEMATEYGGRWDVPVPGMLSLQWRAHRPFHFDLVRYDVRDGIATLTVNRPDAMNALDETLVRQLRERFDEAAADPGVRGIVIAGAGKAFIAGADIRFFVRSLDSGDLQRIYDFTKEGHALLDAIDASPKPVVARVHGLALGGGVELALACDRIVASPKATLAFPETGIGIYPGLGGTQRTTRRVGTGLARWLVFTGQTIGAAEGAAIGLLDRVVPHEELDAAVAEIVAAGSTSPAQRPTLSARHRALEAFFAGADPDALREGRADTGGDEALAKAMKRVGFKAPVALRLAARLIDEGAAGPLDRGLRLELEHLLEIFGTSDAYEGLSTLGKRAPVFQGR